MTRLAWGSSGNRIFEAGTDRGVLYVGNTPGVAWNGLIAVSEKPSGGEPTPYYMDGIKYLNVSASEEYEASISAFSAPDEFGVCDGTSSLANGLFITQQPRKSFGLTYRTLIGNDLEGLDYGYKIHLVYNALSKPTSRDNKTLQQATTPTPFAWDITTLPEMASGYKPSAHFILDTRKTAQILVDELENILYGDMLNDPRLPTALEILDLFDSYVEIQTVVQYDNGTFGIENLPTIVSSTAPTPATGNSTLWLDTSLGDYSVLKQVIGD